MEDSTKLLQKFLNSIDKISINSKMSERITTSFEKLSSKFEIINYHEHFIDQLKNAKGGIIAFLILITLIYNIAVKRNKYSKTYLYKWKYAIKVIIDSFVTFVCGFLSTIFVIKYRGGSWYGKHFKTPFIVGFILGLFVFVQESSGFNKWCSRKEIVEDLNNPYNVINDVNVVDMIEEKIIGEGGDLFMSSISTLTCLIVGILVIYFIINMMRSSYIGYSMEENSLKHFFTKSPITFFIIEICILIVINNLPFVLAPFIRGEKFSKMTTGIIVFGIIITIIFQIMLQYAGMLQFTK